ncbi:MAG TPA: hypothetical protein VH083_21305 [Myxococcales bacterium]|jgi:hypothetical protein|nr:hypothetical protein [Myxococcales bacterium]
MRQLFQVLFLLCATALELHLALMVITPMPYLRFLKLGSSVSPRMRLFCALLLLVVLGVQYAGLTRAI